MPRVTIEYNSSLDKTYQSIVDALNARYHAPGNSFPNYTVGAEELADQAALTTYANHASDGYTMVDNTHVRTPSGQVVHIERLIK